MEQHVRARPYEAHVAFEHVDELRQLVDVGFTHQVAEFEFARVVLGGLYAVAVFVDVHASELQAIELFSVQSVPLLFKENRPRTLYFDDDTCNEVHNRKYGEQKQSGCQNIEKSFDPAVHRVLQRLVSYAQQHGTA